MRTLSHAVIPILNGLCGNVLTLGQVCESPGQDTAVGPEEQGHPQGLATLSPVLIGQTFPLLTSSVYN